MQAAREGGSLALSEFCFIRSDFSSFYRIFFDQNKNKTVLNKYTRFQLGFTLETFIEIVLLFSSSLVVIRRILHGEGDSFLCGVAYV